MLPVGVLPLRTLETLLETICSFSIRILLIDRSYLELDGPELKGEFHLHKKLLSNGISAFQTLTDNLRNIFTDPLDGMEFHSKITTTPLVLKMDRTVHQVTAFVGTLPRKLNVAISGMEASRYNFFA